VARAHGAYDFICGAHQSRVFTGTRRFNPQRSSLNFGAEERVKEITASADEVEVHENILRQDDSQITLAIRARFDGRDYSVTGSPAVDTIAYTRVGTPSPELAWKTGRSPSQRRLTVSSETGLLTLELLDVQRRDSRQRGCGILQPIRSDRRYVFRPTNRK
jgi:hypothetical protein